MVSRFVAKNSRCSQEPPPHKNSHYIGPELSEVTHAQKRNRVSNLDEIDSIYMVLRHNRPCEFWWRSVMGFWTAVINYPILHSLGCIIVCLLPWAMLICGCVSDPKPTCRVITDPPVRGQNVTMSCVVSYIRKGNERRVNPGAAMSASVSCESAAGRVVSSTSTPLLNNIGETLQVNVQHVLTETVIPSFTCTASFTFSGSRSQSFSYAVNTLTWPCVSEPVLTWCKY